MRKGPDGVEVAATSAEAERWPLQPLLVLDSLSDHLDAIGQGSGPISWERIGDGHSNMTYRIQRSGADLVLRRGPRPPLPRSAHDMPREAWLQKLLNERGVPTPRIVNVCEDESVLGVPFYLMGWLDGDVVTSHLPAHLDVLAERRRLSRVAVDSLVALHSVTLDGDVAGLGRPEGYLSRQVERFSQLWEVNTTRHIPEVAALGRWLMAELPTTQRHSVVHGDFRLGNLMMSSHGPASVLAILDWEMATLGDPLADLGYFIATYADRGAPVTPMELTPVTRGDGFARGHELSALYAERTGLDLGALPWYECLALWKAAVFCEAIYSRYLRGERPGDTFGPTLEAGVPAMLDVARLRASRLT